MKVNVITFPGSNCDHDAYDVMRDRGHQVDLIWHKETELKNPDLLILPGGFSYGDYLRCGAIARFSPIIKEVMRIAESGALILGICNGFQILTEIGLLPGALMMNESLKFICQHQHIRVENSDTPFTHGTKNGMVLEIPIAHKEGNYFIDTDGLKILQDNGQIVFRYCDSEGKVHASANPNGSLDGIAGICNKRRNVLGMMPHPERAATDSVKGSDGKYIFEALEKHFSEFC